MAKMKTATDIDAPVWPGDGVPEYSNLSTTETLTSTEPSSTEPPDDTPIQQLPPPSSSEPSSNRTPPISPFSTFFIPPRLLPRPPILSTIPTIFTTLLRTALSLSLSPIVSRGPGFHMRVGTLCSGTDAPIFALMELREAAAGMGVAGVVSWEHVFSAEIEEFKQAFIRRNVRGGRVFRDVEEMARRSEAMTAEGFMEKVGEGVDLLIFGSSCVDFSNLNNSKKAFAKSVKIDIKSTDFRHPEPGMIALLSDLLTTAEGESSRTFLAGLLYISRYRPSVIIMENVINAPWEEIANFWFAKIGYKARYVKVNTKDYGIPHIRMRGYLVAVDAGIFDDDDGAERFTETWEGAMRALEIEEPAPLNGFVLQPGDQRLLQHRSALRKTGKSLRMGEARMCRLRHAEARREEGLPSGSRYTFMDARGHCTPRDDSFIEAIQELGEREKDLLDITYERGLQKGYDMAHKLQVYDISQNVDRAPGQLGLTPCLTPKGNPFVTDQGRPLLGIEALSLQGIDMDRIVPSIETQAQLQDLAGNAMTTTVVGAAILAVLMAHVATLGSQPFRAAKQYGPAFTEEQECDRNVVCNTGDPVDILSLGIRRPRQLDGMTVTEVQRFFLENRVWCPYEGGYNRDRGADLWICKACLEVRCGSCKGNPKHWFESMTNRKVADMPMALMTAQNIANASFTFVPYDPDTPQSGARQGECFVEIPGLGTLMNSYDLGEDIAAVLEEIRSGVRYIFTRVHVGRDITFFYRGEPAEVRIVIGNRTVAWEVWADTGTWIARRWSVDMARPLLRAVVERGSVIPRVQDWSVWVAGYIEIHFTASCNFNRGIAAISLAPKDTKVYDSQGYIYKNTIRLTEQIENLTDAVAGTYHVSRQCGTPYGLVAAKQGTLPGSRLFILQNVGPDSDPEDDPIVLATSCRRMQGFEQREIVTELMGWDWTGDMAVVRAACKGWWSRHPVARDPRPEGVNAPITLGEDALWIARRGEILVHWDVLPEKLSVDSLTHAGRPFTTITLPSGLPWSSPLISVLLHPFSQLSHTTSDLSGWIILPERYHAGIFKFLFHIFKSISPSALRRLLPASSFRSHTVSTGHCSFCAPVAPTVHRVPNKEGRVIDLVSDQSDCYAFEKILKQRPAVLSLQMRRGHNDQIVFRVSLNVETLVHRAMGYLPVPKVALGKVYGGDVDVKGNIETWHITSSMRNLRPFLSDILPIDPMPKDGILTGQPPPFIANGKKLRPDQMAAVKWMIAERYQSVRPFSEQEVEEHMVPELGMRVAGTVKRKNFVRGAVLAHEVGYGKTVVSLALLDYLRADIPSCLTERQSAVCNRPIIHLKASLIIVPHHLIKQWSSEVTTFLQNKQNPWSVHLISSKADALALDRQAMEKADIIIVSFRAIQMAQGRLDLLATAGGQVKLSEKEGGRKLADWYDKVVEFLRPAGDDPEESCFTDSAAIDEVTEKRRQQVCDSIIAAQKRQIPRSTRKTGTKTKDNVFDISVAKNISKSKPSFLWKRGALFEMYSYSSIIYDEFSYNEPHIALFVKRALAGAKWMLSGTPPVGCLGDIAEMAGLLGVHVAREEPAIPGYLPRVTVGPSTKEMSSAEQFRSYRQLKSPTFVAERDALAREFLRQMTRRNAAVQGDYRVFDVLVPVTMDSVTSVVYNVAQQVLGAARWSWEDVQGDVREMVAEMGGFTGDFNNKRGSLGTRKMLTVAAEALGFCASGKVGDLMQRMGSMRVSIGHVLEKEEWTILEAMRGLLEQQERQVRLLEGPLRSLWGRMCYLSKRLDADPEFDIDKVGAGDARRGKQRSAEGLRSQVIKMVFGESSEDDVDEGMVRLRDVLFEGFEGDRRKVEERLRRGKCGGWAKWEEGLGMFGVVDWYADLEAAVENMQKGSQETQWLFDDLVHSLGLPASEIPDLSQARNPKDILRSLIVQAKSVLPKPSSSDLLETENSQHAAAFHRCRTLGLKAAPIDSMSTLQDRLSRFNSGKSRESDFEFQSALPSVMPWYGHIKMTRGAGIDAGLDDFILTVQAVDLGVRNHWVVAGWRLRMIKKAVAFLEMGTAGGSGVMQCDVCGENINKIKDGWLLVTCGHVYCQHCQGKWGAEERCVVDVCQSTARCALVRAADLLPTPGISIIRADAPSPKVTKILELVQEILAKNEAVVIFVQSGLLKGQITSALLAASIPFATTSGSNSAAVLSSFQNGEIPVLLQSLMSEESAGSNLTRATHVIFAAPMMAGREIGDMFLRQAVGRVNRPGQERDVWVWWVVTRGTVEGDVLEQRWGGEVWCRGDAKIVGEGGEIWREGDRVGRVGEDDGKKEWEFECLRGERDVEGRLRAHFDEREVGRLLAAFEEETEE